MLIKPRELLDRATTTVYALTIMFAFCGLFLVPSGQSILSNLLVVSGVFGLLNYFVGGNRDVFFIDRRLLWAFMFYAAIILLNRVVHGDQYGIMRGLFYVSIFSLMMPKNKIILSLGWVAIVAGGIGLGLLSVWQFKSGLIRVEGFTNAILFSQAALILAILNWCAFSQSKENDIIKYIALFSMMSSIVALYFSQSRGVWLALGGVIIIHVIYKGFHKPVKYTIIALLLAASMGGIYQTNTIVQDRVADAASDIRGIEGGTYYSSWGLRVVAWESAWLGFLNSPIIGVGTDGFTAVKEQQVAQGLVSPLVMDPALVHAHSQYMQNLVVRGLIGIFGLLIFIFYPMKLLVEKTGWGSLYMMIPLSISICAFSDVPFEHQNVLYLYSLSLIFAWCATEFTIKENQS
ncbi:O-antigen ligase family protein [Aeromonas veronii]|uniref:O-antigen ligase family protein n=1 Tax=Aeromonas veronii TaxID=654 RepID=UPI0032EBDFF1